MRFFTFIISLFLAQLTTSCFDTEQNCTDYKTGKFEFEYEINGINKKTQFERTKDLEISLYNGKKDTASVRWINDCEYIVQKLHPKNRLERKAVHMKILTTTDKGYTFEFSIVGNPKKQRGTVTKITN